MPKKAQGASRSKKSASRKPVRKALKKKTLKKKSASKKTAKKKAAAKKKALKKKTVKKIIKKRTTVKAKPARKKVVWAEQATVEPGPPIVDTQPIEEPVQLEDAIGTVTHFYSHLNVVVIQLNKSKIKIGDTIHIKGHHTDFTQKVESMEFEHQPVQEAIAGQAFGLKVDNHAREHDIVYKKK